MRSDVQNRFLHALFSSWVSTGRYESAPACRIAAPGKEGGPEGRCSGFAPAPRAALKDRGRDALTSSKTYVRSRDSSKEDRHGNDQSVDEEGDGGVRETVPLV